MCINCLIFQSRNSRIYSLITGSAPRSGSSVSEGFVPPSSFRGWEPSVWPVSHLGSHLIWICLIQSAICTRHVVPFYTVFPRLWALLSSVFHPDHSSSNMYCCLVRINNDKIERKKIPKDKCHAV